MSLSTLLEAKLNLYTHLLRANPADDKVKKMQEAFHTWLLVKTRAMVNISTTEANRCFELLEGANLPEEVTTDFAALVADTSAGSGVDRQPIILQSMDKPHLFLTADDFQCLLGEPPLGRDEVLHLIAARMSKLGLRAPREATTKMLVALAGAVLKEYNESELHTMVHKMKDFLRSHRVRAATSRHLGTTTPPRT
jgi:hypothetical protein